MTDDDLRRLWREHGGSFHGPNVETGTMPEAKLLPLLRGLMTGLVGEAGGGYPRQVVTFAEVREGTVFSFTGGRLRFEKPPACSLEHAGWQVRIAEGPWLYCPDDIAEIWRKRGGVEMRELVAKTVP